MAPQSLELHVETPLRCQTIECSIRNGVLEEVEGVVVVNVDTAFGVVSVCPVDVARFAAVAVDAVVDASETSIIS